VSDNHDAQAMNDRSKFYNMEGQRMVRGHRHQEKDNMNVQRFALGGRNTRAASDNKQRNISVRNGIVTSCGLRVAN